MYLAAAGMLCTSNDERQQRAADSYKKFIYNIDHITIFYNVLNKQMKYSTVPNNKRTRTHTMLEIVFIKSIKYASTWVCLHNKEYET